MKKVLSLLSVVASTSVFALTLNSSNTLGLQKVEINSKNAILAVPFVECGSGAAVPVQDVVKTANLAEGDQLFVYDTGTTSYSATFQLTDGEWVRTDAAGKDSTEKVTLARGQALMLSRTTSNEVAVYLYGEMPAGNVASTSVATAGSAETPAYTLVASPKIGEADIELTSEKFSRAGGKDSIFVPGDREYFWVSGTNGSGFGIVKVGIAEGKMQKTVAFAKVAPGAGIWYINRGEAVTVNW